MIVFDHVSYAYPAAKATPVVRDVSFTVGDGEEVAIMGANGCGKTTLGLLMAGLLEPDSGTVTVRAGERTSESENDAPVVGFLFQDPDNGLVATTVEREVAFSLENRNMPNPQMRKIVDDTLTFFEMNGIRERLVWNLSGGEKQRLSLAGLFASGPKILFLDEPASFLDHPGARQLDAIIRRIRETDPRLTVIRITQYARVAETFGRILVMSHGEMIADAGPQEVFGNHDLLSRIKLRPPLKYMTPRREAPSKAGDNQPGRRLRVLGEVDRIGFEYEDGRGKGLFENLSLEIHKGEVLGLVGPSGSGKSTLAQMICGIYQPTSGAIRFNDPSCRVSMSFQQPERQFFLDTAYSEVLYGIKQNIESDKSRDETVYASMQMAGLDYVRFRNRDPHTLSGGEARRLAFAIVVALNTDLIIFDEPTCGLDDGGIGAFRRMVRSLQSKGKTIVIISHNSDIIADLADRVALLKDGRITATAPPREFFSSDEYKAILPTPEIIDFQMGHYGDVSTARTDDLFDLSHFYA